MLKGIIIIGTIIGGAIYLGMILAYTFIYEWWRDLFSNYKKRKI